MGELEVAASGSTVGGYVGGPGRLCAGAPTAGGALGIQGLKQILCFEIHVEVMNICLPSALH
jgi:hypothetical protein